MGTHLNTGTGADLLTFETYRDATRHVDRITRVATADQEWVVKDWDGETYCISFEKNFSKKHLFTFTKKIEKTQAAAYVRSQAAGQQGKDAENWQYAELEMLKGKIARNLDKRAVVDVCGRCGHKLDKHRTGGGASTPCKFDTGGGVKCACDPFRTAYEINRGALGKPTPNPLAGAKTDTNTCIILNWVPKGEFEFVVCSSIQAHEKPHGWHRGQPLSVPAAPPGSNEATKVLATRELTWDFGAARMGAVLRKQIGGAWESYRGCRVKATKIGTDLGRQKWQVWHMETDPAKLIS